MREALLLVFLALPIQAQDEAGIKELIQNLDDDSFEVREKAEKALVALGELAVPHLRIVVAETQRQKEKAEVRTRALSALRAIEFNVKSRQYYSEPKFVTLRAADAELASVLADLEKQTGVRIDAGGIEAKAKVTLQAENAPLFKVLDELCRGQEERSYEYRDEGIRFARSRFIPYPSAYEGPFRIRVVKLKHERSTDFKIAEGLAQVTLEADWQKYLKPSRRIGLEIRTATDDKGATLEIEKAGSSDDDNGGVIVVGNGRFVMRRGGVVVAAGGADEATTTQLFNLKGLSAGAARISLQGSARFSFPLEKTNVVFDRPASPEPQQTGDLTIAIKSQGSGRIWKLTLTHTPGRPPVIPEEIDARIDKESFVALDENGKEHKATLNESRGTEMQIFLRGVEVPDGTPLASYQAMFPTLQTRMPKEIRFKFVSQIFVKTIPFTLKDVALP
jgi:hypothetical protein